MTETTIMDWVRGEIFGLDFPAHPAALKAGGPEFLARAFRTSGVPGQDNRVPQIICLDEWTGRHRRTPRRRHCR